MNLMTIGDAVIDGVLSVPGDLYYGGRRILENTGAFGTEVRRQNAEEEKRILALLRSLMDNRRLLQEMVEIIIGDFFERLPNSLKMKIHEKATLKGTFVVSRTATQFYVSGVISRKLAQKIVANIMAKMIVRVGTGFILSAVLIAGLVERSSNASRRLARVNPAVYRKLVSKKLDPMYFLVEDILAPILSIPEMERLDHSTFQKIIEDLERRVDGAG